jgi:hypothetical protein
MFLITLCVKVINTILKWNKNMASAASTSAPTPAHSSYLSLGWKGCMAIVNGTCFCVEKIATCGMQAIIGSSLELLVGLPLEATTHLAAQRYNLIAPRTESTVSTAVGLAKLFLPKNEAFFDLETIEKSACPLIEICRQFNAQSPQNPITPERLKKLIQQGAVVEGPLVEELICRGLIQDVLLKRLPQLALRWTCPRKEWLIDTTVAKIVRITLSAGFFSQLLKNSWRFAP